MLCDGCVTALGGECPDFCPFFGIRQAHNAPGCVQEILELGFDSLRCDDFRRAIRYFGRVLSYDSKNGRALLGMLIASAEAHSENELSDILKENMQQDNAIFQHILRKTMEFAPDEIRGVFSDDYYDACKLMKAGKYKKALRIFRAIKDYHSDASDMADECLRLLAIDITGALKSSVPLEKKEIAIDPEILSIRHELQAMIDRYVGAVDEKSSEYIFAVNASHLERYMKLSYSDHILSDKIRKLKFLNDARSILRMTREFLERSNNIPKVPALQEDIPISIEAQAQQIEIPVPNTRKVPRWLQFTVITVGFILLALMLAPTLLMILALL